MQAVVTRFSRPAAAVLLAVGCLLLGPTLAAAAPSAAEAFPATTVGFVSVGDTPDFVSRWRSTQVGRLGQDPSMRPFLEQVEARFATRFGGVEDRLGVTVDDLRDAASGESALGLVKTGDPERPDRVAVLVDATGRDAQAADLLAKIDARLTERGGAKRAGDRGVTLYDLPAEPEAKLPARTTAVFRSAGYVGAAEGEQLAGTLIARLEGVANGGSLADTPAFRETQARAQRSARGARADLVWFVSPFEMPDIKETLATLAGQGFDAIRGIGGVVAVASTPERDFVHHTFAYAPPKPGTAGKPAAEKYDLAMRMLELPNNNAPLTADNPPIELYAPRQVATYKTLHIDVQNAFRYVGTLFDAFAGYEDAFETTLRGFEKDPYGPKIKIEEEVVAHLGKRVVVMTDYTLPITPECERYLIAIDVTDEEALRDPINRWLENDGAERKELQGVPYWEMVPEDEALSADELDPLLPLDEPIGSQPEEREERVLRRAAVCLHQGRLVIGSDADFLRQALFGVSPGESLSGSPDVRYTIGHLRQLAPGDRCAWTFSRNDEALRPTYELVREGRMPEAQTFFGRLLNRLLTTEEQREVGAHRVQKIDGRKLPTFELARRYFGPSARSVRSEGDGWLITGVVLSKSPLFDGPSASVAQAPR